MHVTPTPHRFLVRPLGCTIVSTEIQISSSSSSRTEVQPEKGIEHPTKEVRVRVAQGIITTCALNIGELSEALLK